MPRLWTETIQSHRREVQETILETTARLIAEGGLLSVTMSEIASATGIGRATLYKYFPDVEAILSAWHERQIARHLERLIEARDQAEGAGQRLESVLVAYAQTYRDARPHHQSDVAAWLHRGGHVSQARNQLLSMITELIADAAAAGEVRDDVPADELAAYCLEALAAAARLRSIAAVHRLVGVTMDGISRRQ